MRKIFNRLLKNSELRNTVLSQIHVNQDRFMKLLTKINENRDSINVLENMHEKQINALHNDVDELKKQVALMRDVINANSGDRDRIKLLEDQVERLFILAKEQARDIDALQKRRWWE